MSQALLKAEGLTVSFDGFKAVDNLNLYVERDEIRALIGPNGAGKTTVLDLISGKTRPTEGKVMFGVQEVTGLDEHQVVRHGIGRKFQTPSVYENLTVFENLEMSYPAGRDWLSCWRFTRNDTISSKVKEIADIIYLGDKLDELAALLSHGQKQWLEIGMLLIQDPQLMMLDEPVAGMSVNERRKTADLLRTVGKGRAVLVVEHDMEFVKLIADQVTVLHQGKLLAEGRMERVQSDPKVIEVYLGH